MYDTQPPKPSRERLPTMYDLPSEDVEESGLPDEFHPTQAQLLTETFCSPVVPAEQCFIGTDINLYYDSRHTQWYKRPDWFLVTGVASSATIEEMRWSYVIWQESVAPFLVVELLSAGTEDEDLGQTLRVVGKSPTKWEVYERLLRVPYYVLFDRVTQQLRVFKLEGYRYVELNLVDERLWVDEVQLGLGVWVGRYRGSEGRWLRWYDADDRWIPTDHEQAAQAAARVEQETTRAEQAAARAEQAAARAEQVVSELAAERAQADRLRERLRSLGIDPDEV